MNLCEVKYEKNIFIFLSICWISIFSNIHAQTAVNLKKYWYYRDRLEKKFVYVSPNNEQGSNIPAAFISSTTLWWDDGNSAISHYLGVLATEYRLLKNNNKDYTKTLRELKYALAAVDRIDATAEFHYGGANNLNGFFLRDDVANTFWDKYKKGGTAEYYDQEYFNSCFKDTKSEMSQDNVWHLLEGLALIKALVIKEPVDGVNVDFPKWAQEITYRVIKVMQHTEKYSVQLTGLISYNIYWYLMNPVTNNLVSKGSGSDLDNEFIWSYGFAEAGNWILNVGIVGSKYSSLHYKSSDGIAKTIFTNIFNDESGSYEFRLVGIPIVTFDKDFYNVNSLATVAGNMEDTYNKLLWRRDFPIYYGPYEHFPLMYLVLHEKNNFKINKYGSDFYESEKAYYQSLLNEAPEFGPYKYDIDSFGSYEWSTVSRLVWPENLGNFDMNTLGEFSGLDYMLLHNLYYLVYEDDFRYKSNTFFTPFTFDNPPLSSLSLAEENNNVEVYPNPNNGSFIIQCHKKIPAKIEIYNSTGILIYNMKPVSDNISINLSVQSPGIHYIKTIYPNYTASEKIMVLKQ